MIEGLAPSGRGEFEITDVLNHYIPGGGLFTEVYDGHLDGRRHGPEPPPRRRARRAGRRRRTAVRAGRAAGRSGMTDAGADRRPARTCSSPAARGSSARSSCAGSWPATTGRGSPSSTSSPTPATAPTSPRSRPTGSRPPASPSSAATSRTRTSSRRSSPRPTPSSTSPPRRTSIARILDPEAFLRTGVIGVHVLLEAVRREAGRAAAGDAGHPRFLQVSTDEVYGDIAEGRSVESRPARPAQPVRRREGGRRAARPRLPRHLRPRHGRHPRLEHLRPAPAPREAHPAVRDQRARRRAAADVRRRDAGPRLAPRLRTTPRASSSSCATASPARPTTSPAARSCRTARSSARLLAAAGPRLVARPHGPGPARPRPPVRDGRRRSSHALGWSPAGPVRARPPRDRRLVPRQRRPGSRRPRAATGTPTTSAQYASRLARAPPRTSRRSRQADPCGSRSPAPTGASAGRSSRRSRRRRSPGRWARSPGRARSSTSTPLDEPAVDRLLDA